MGGKTNSNHVRVEATEYNCLLYTHQPYIMTAHCWRSTDEPSPIILVSNEWNSNVDAFCLGKNLVTPTHKNRVVNVYDYYKDLGILRDVPIISRATACDGARTGKINILII